MKQDPFLTKMAFPFVRIAPRPAKPRESSLTVAVDRGMGTNRVADLLQTAGEYIDFSKLARAQQ